ncbi:hypothetical protein [Sphingomonas agri]|uniref:hypothetical protein n=1 Tax=Sphingomonas agri TaxID=1813878 RepID=UPI00311D71AB
MVPITGAALNKSAAVRVVFVGRIEQAAAALAARSVALEIAEVTARSCDRGASNSHHPTSHERVPCTESGETLAAHKAPGYNAASTELATCE